MSYTRLHSIEINNFRSLTATGEVRLDAPVVLLHGPNGAGKTSFLSAIELALTGEISSMQRVDQGYKKHLLRDGTPSGGIILKMVEQDALMPRESRVALSRDGAKCDGKLEGKLAQFFSERCFLAQSSLTQLLTIYQQPGAGIDSPLSAFVRELLGLDRLDAIERGLEAAMDIRNTRKVVPTLLAVERSRDALTQERLRVQGKTETARALVDAALLELTASLTHLGMEIPEDISQFSEGSFDTSREAAQMSRMFDAQQRLDAIERRNLQVANIKATSERTAIEAELTEAESQLNTWQDGPGKELSDLIQAASALKLIVSIPETRIADQMPALEAAWSQEATRLASIISGDEVSNKRLRDLDDNRTTIQSRLLNLDAQMSQTVGDVELLARALSEILPHVHGDECPVCQRDYSEFSEEALSAVVAIRIKELGDSAERQRALASERVSLERERLTIERDIETVRGTLLTISALQDLQSRLAEVQKSVNSARRLMPQSVVGTILLDRAANARQAFDRLVSSNSEEAAIRQDTSDIVASLNFSSDASEPIIATLSKAKEQIGERTGHLRDVMAFKSQAATQLQSYRKAVQVKLAADNELSSATAAEEVATSALGAADQTRKAIRTLVGVVGKARADVIGRVFNDRLNLIWRDLFVRLAPMEQFVPAFFPLSPGTRASAPTLRTAKRSGGHGGAPGTMLSAGNLNTAALTLFLALHLAVQRKLPWLILDDPVQSMDEVHVSQFAALLRTLSKDNDRQILITVHEKALYDYLTLELSPAFESDELITIEISPSANGETRIVPRRIFYRQDDAIVSVAAA